MPQEVSGATYLAFYIESTQPSKARKQRTAKQLITGNRGDDDVATLGRGRARPPQTAGIRPTALAHFPPVPIHYPSPAFSQKSIARGYSPLGSLFRGLRHWEAWC